jgi:hypothetical protein
MTVYYDGIQRTWIDAATKKIAGNVGAITTLSAIEKQVQKIAYLCLKELNDNRKVEFKSIKHNQVTQTSIIFSKSELKQIKYFPVWAALVFCANGYEVTFCGNGYVIEVSEKELIRLYTLMVVAQNNKTLDYLLKVC